MNESPEAGVGLSIIGLLEGADRTQKEEARSIA